MLELAVESCDELICTSVVVVVAAVICEELDILGKG